MKRGIWFYCTSKEQYATLIIALLNANYTFEYTGKRHGVLLHDLWAYDIERILNDINIPAGFCEIKVY